MSGPASQNATPLLVSPVSGAAAAASRTAAIRAALLGGVSMLALAGVMLPHPALAQDQIIPVRQPARSSQTALCD